MMKRKDPEYTARLMKRQLFHHAVPSKYGLLRLMKGDYGVEDDIMKRNAGAEFEARLMKRGINKSCIHISLCCKILSFSGWTFFR